MNKNIFYTLLISCILIFSTQTYAQPNLKSGSLQIIISNSTPVMAEITGPLSFRETISENIILSNLIPGEYRVRISTTQRGRRGPTSNQPSMVNQVVIVNPEQRTIVSTSRGQTSIRSVFDENSQYVHASINPNIRPNSPNYHQGVPLMNENEFKQLYNAIRGESFEENKMRIVNATADYISFSTEQIGQVMRLFSFDKERLECAKAMSGKTYDSHNLYLLAELFSFSSTKNDFFDFIKNIPQAPQSRPIR